MNSEKEKELTQDQIEQNKKIYRAAKICDTLNAWLKEDPFWVKERGCPKEDLVEKFGFGYSAEAEPSVYYSEEKDMYKVDINLLTLEAMIQAANSTEKKRQTLKYVYVYGNCIYKGRV